MGKQPTASHSGRLGVEPTPERMTKPY